MSDRARNARRLLSTIITKAVLLAAGRGTRMRELTSELPKPMIAVRGKPILQHIIEGLHAAGVKQFLVIVGYRAEVVREFLGDGVRLRRRGQLQNADGAGWNRKGH